MVNTMQLLLVGTLAAAAGAATLAAPAQDSRPGVVSQMRVFIENRNLAEAIPVSVQEVRTQRPILVQIDQTVQARPVTVQVDGVVQARQAAQQWEYTTAPQARLAELGTQGWEAFGVVTTTEGVAIALKRPR
jgi:hypothetical protein